MVTFMLESNRLANRPSMYVLVSTDIYICNDYVHGYVTGHNIRACTNGMRVGDN